MRLKKYPNINFYAHMRKVIIVMMLIGINLSLLASNSASEGSLNERFYQAKLRELAYQLNITSEQQAKFEPIYRRYCEEMTALWAERKKPIPPNTSSKAAAIEKLHEERYLKLLNNIKQDIVFSRDGDTIWQCTNCGHVVIGKKAPEMCPVCNHPQAYFQIKAENY